MQELRSSSYHGTFTWRVEGMSEKLSLSRHGGRQNYNSIEFYIEPQAYKYQLQMDMNGTLPTHASIRLVTVKVRYSPKDLLLLLG